MAASGGSFKSALIGGIFIVLPIILVVFLVAEALDMIGTFTDPIAELLPVEEIGGVAVAELVGLAILLLICFLVGAGVRTKAGSRANRWLEESVLGRVPGYRAIRNMLRQFGGQEADGMFIPAVVTMAPDVLALGLTVEEHDNGYVTVMIPSAPTATSGIVRYMPARDVRKIDATFTDVFNAITYWGAGSGELFRSDPGAVADDQASRD